ncbi:hypothetical protein IV45_GL000319 [Limosilactobacillus secaliphilus]|uniref:CSD domain-containing protein n=2 Tax=Limosilactobacillus secaliphilus TaxID=396268 RepID=A0A0R2I9E5_9LACO|nr:hypothetical protein IV45_GL000319 [Limosilactobacillus secaliphilus]
MNKMIGTVKNYDAAKGWGFITIKDEGDVFVHSRGIEKSSRRFMRPGAKVQLVVIPGARSKQAAHVRVIQ